MEIFKDIKGYEGIYQISNLGIVKSLTHYPKGRTGKQTGRVLKQITDKKGYVRVSLSKNGTRFNTSVHRLVALTFIPNTKNKPQVNHINGIKNDNRIKNLEWCTGSENVIHSIGNNLSNFNYGEKHHMSKLNNKQAIELRNQFEKGESVKDLSKKYNLSVVAIYNIINNKTYKN